jgi:hypothetical protein
MHVNRCCNFRDRHAVKKAAKKTPNLKNLTTEIQHLWNVKTKVIPVITGATGTIPTTINMGNNITSTINHNYRIRITLYTLKTGLFQVYNCKYPE